MVLKNRYGRVRWVRLVVVALVGTLPATGCVAGVSSQSGGSGGGSGASQVGTAVIGPSGGSVVSADGVVELDVPAGALSGATTITIAASSATSPDAVGPLYDIEPTGTRFAVPAKLTIHYDPKRIPAGATESDVGLATQVAGKTEPQQLGVVDTSTHTLVGFIEHLSPWYAAVIPKLHNVCKVDVGCASKCCADGAFSGNTCLTVCIGREFLAYTDCYSKCVQTAATTNFANSACFNNCCSKQSGSVGRNGVCLLGSAAKANTVVDCARGCFKPGDKISLCPTNVCSGGDAQAGGSGTGSMGGGSSNGTGGGSGIIDGGTGGGPGAIDGGTGSSGGSGGCSQNTCGPQGTPCCMDGSSCGSGGPGGGGVSCTCSSGLWQCSAVDGGIDSGA